MKVEYLSNNGILKIQPEAFSEETMESCCPNEKTMQQYLTLGIKKTLTAVLKMLILGYFHYPSHYNEHSKNMVYIPH